MQEAALSQEGAAVMGPILGKNGPYTIEHPVPYKLGVLAPVALVPNRLNQTHTQTWGSHKLHLEGQTGGVLV